MFATPEQEALYWAKKAAEGKLLGRKATEQNGLLEGKPIPDGPTSRKQLAAWLNDLAHKVHIERTQLNPTGYYATADNIG